MDGSRSTELLAKIARALKDPAATVLEMVQLSERATIAEAASGLTAADARAMALDPALAPEHVADALAEANRAAHDAARLAAAREALEALIAPRQCAILEQERQQRRAQGLAERDRMAKRLKAECPDALAHLIAILMDLMRNNADVDAANRERVEGEEILQRAEGLARGFDTRWGRDDLSNGGAPYNYGITRLTQIVLPDFEHPDKLAWPPNLTGDQAHRIRSGQPNINMVQAGYRAWERTAKP